MADQNDDIISGLNDVLQTGTGVAGALSSNSVMNQAYQTMLQNLARQMGNYDNLKDPGYKQLTAPQLDQSNLNKVQYDPAAKAAQQQSMSSLQDIINRGGLSLQNMQALNQTQQNLNRNDSARNASIANSFAAKGQLGSGASLAMQLANAQNSAQNANQQGEAQNAQAQQQAMQALLQKGQIGRQMGNDTYSRDAQAAQANDAINKMNAQFGLTTGEYNNQVLGQGYQDQLNKFKGEQGVTNQLNDVILGQGKQNASTVSGITGAASGLLGNLGKLGSIGSGTKNADGSTTTKNADGTTTTTMPNGDVVDQPGTQNTGNDNTNLQPDPNDVNDNDNLQPDPNDPDPE